MKAKALLLLASLAVGHTLADTTSDALSWGASKNQGVFDAGTQDPSTILPTFPTTADQSGLFGDGTQISPVVNGSVVKVTDCANNTPDPDTYKRQECGAINWWQKNPSIRPQANVSRATDPMVVRAVTIGNNPQSVTGTMPGIAGTYTNCTTQVIPGAKTYTTSSCSESLALDPFNCQTYWDVQVDQDFAYKCDQSDYTLNESTCTWNAIPNITYTPTPYAVATTTESAPAQRVTTYSWALNFNGDPLSMLLNWIQGGDYIQLYVNGFAVYSNAPYSDVRNSWWGNTPGSNCGSWLYTRWGANLGPIGANYCALAECSTGVNPNKDITNYFHTGYNIIELTCINVSGTTRPCQFGMTGSINVPSLGSVGSDSGCAVFEQRAK